MGHALQAELAAMPGLQVLILYGSAAADRLRADSDVDVAVLFAVPLSVDQRLAVASRLEQLLGRPVDLVDLGRVDGLILQQILCKGKLLVRNDPAAYSRLLQRMLYNQTDMMPYCRRAWRQHAQRFAHA